MAVAPEVDPSTGTVTVLLEVAAGAEGRREPFIGGVTHVRVVVSWLREEGAPHGSHQDSWKRRPDSSR